MIRAATRISGSGPGGEYTEQVRPLGNPSPRCVIVAPGSGSDGSGYVVERAPNAGSSTPGGTPALTARDTAADGWCLTAAGFGAGTIGGSYDPAVAADMLATLAATLTGSSSPWGGCTGPPVVVGVSLGFITAIAVLIRHPGLIGGVVGVVPVTSAEHIWDHLYAAPVPAEVVPYAPETHHDAFDGVPVTLLTVRADGIVDHSDDRHTREFVAATGATWWRFGVGVHGTWELTPRVLRAALATIHSVS